MYLFYSLQAKAMETGFDNIFGEGPTPSHSAMAGERDMQQVDNFQTTLKLDNQMPGGAVCPTRDGWGQPQQRGWDECVNLSISIQKTSHAHTVKNCFMSQIISHFSAIVPAHSKFRFSCI